MARTRTQTVVATWVTANYKSHIIPNIVHAQLQIARLRVPADGISNWQALWGLKCLKAQVRIEISIRLNYQKTHISRSEDILPYYEY